MSNHHPGNEWYRRLIRSNRPLYRACPKHTKLLVAKAIVQAVEQQNGRFLERDKGSVQWFTISYKRAVDKTSQGLREKDRDLDSADDSRKEDWKKRENDSGLTGRLSKAPTLADMTKRVIVRAESSKLAMPRKPGRVKGSGSSKSSHPQAEQVKKAANTNTVPIRPLLPGKGALNSKQPPIQTGVTPVQNSDATPAAAPVTAFQRTSTTDTWTPLPPTIQMRQSSMYRNLQGSSLLPASNAKSVKKHQGKQQQPRPVLPTNQTLLAPNGIITPQAYARAPAPSKTMVPMIVPYGTPAQWGISGANLQQAPELSRFTSQVSDWLNSFWPMPEDGPSKTASNRMQPRAALPLVTLEEEQPSDEAIAAVAGRPLPPKKRPAEGAEQDSKPSAAPDAVRLDRKINKRKSLTMPPLPYASVPDRTTPHCPNNETARHSLLPSELEQSVSATLLQLASSPTKLFSGLTSYFADDLDSETALKEKKRSADNNDNVDEDQNSKRLRKRESLLEDYEETPMEARLRLVQYS